MQTVDIDGTFLEVHAIPAPATCASPPGTDGALPPLVFLHEGLGSVAMWRDWPARLCAATGRAGWVYSRRGYGQSSPVPDVRGTPRQDAQGRRIGRLLPDYLHHEALVVLPALLQRLGVAQPVLVGHSDGGTIALIHAAHHPVAACVVMAPHVMVEAVALQGIARTRDAFTTGGLRQRLSRYHADVDCAFWQWCDAWLGESIRGFDIRDEIRRIRAPLLAIQGVNDEYATLAQIRDIQAAVPRAELLELPDCGHSPFKDQPGAVDEAIAGFLRRHLAQAR